ncbi:MAG: extracellular solute-binding protein [Butyrivibrio sp.]|nr:extracellular solute-binding protein [Muribaculum sp.]MCM1552537.1 extracellular solute-binding protein [Butyrivibrio sp.]
MSRVVFGIAVLAVVLAVCVRVVQKRTETNRDTVEDGFVWVTEYIYPEIKKSLDVVRVRDNFLYYEDYGYNAEGRSSLVISSISLLDGSKGPTIPIEIEKPETPTDGQVYVSRRLSGLAFDSAEKVVTVEYVRHINYDAREVTVEYYCCRYDVEGKREWDIELANLLAEHGESGIKGVDIDAENRIYLYCENGILLLDAEGDGAGYIDVSEYDRVDSMGVGRDGKAYIAVCDPKNSKYVLRELNFARKKLGASYSNYIDVYIGGGLAVGMEKDFMGIDYYGLYEYDMEHQTKEKVLNWFERDVNPSNIQCLCALGDNRVAVLTYDWENNQNELAILSKVPVSEAPQKVEITIASLDDEGQVQRAAVKFNKRNDKYHISVKSYFDENDVTWSMLGNNYNQVLGDAVERLNADIVSDHCPDMLVLDRLNVSRYASKGIFEDLSGWLDRSNTIRRDDYFENVLECYTCDGILVAIPQSFQMSTLVGRASDLGTEPGWTLQDIMDYANAHPDAKLLPNTSKEHMLQTLFQYTQNSFVDWQSGQCSFDSDAFVELLEFADRFPDKYEYDSSYATQIGKGEILLNTVQIYDFEMIQVSEALFGEPVNYIGYPNQDGDSGIYLTDYTGGLAIMAASANKEGAWEFLESFLSQDNSYQGFPSQISKFEEEKAEAVRVKYVYEKVLAEDGTFLVDDEGEYIYKLDDEGNPVIELNDDGEPMLQSQHWTGFGTLEYTFHTPTVEEADGTEELVRMAKPASNYDIVILNIVNEEAPAFFKGQKSAEKVASLIQSRVQLYVNENR